MPDQRNVPAPRSFKLVLRTPEEVSHRPWEEREWAEWWSAGGRELWAEYAESPDDQELILSEKDGVLFMCRAMEIQGSIPFTIFRARTKRRQRKRFGPWHKANAIEIGLGDADFWLCELEYLEGLDFEETTETAPGGLRC